MTVKELCAACQLNEICMPAPEREVQGAYVGDLLSWVMGRAFEDNVWITIMSNINVIAVASLSDVSCIILAEGVTLEEEIKATAQQKGVNVLCSDKPAFETALMLKDKV